MVTLARRTPEQLRQCADRLLPSLIAHWEDLPKTLTEIESWDSVELATYVEEWRLREEQRANLQRYAATNVFTDHQKQQVDQLRELATEHEAIVAQLLGVSGLLHLHPQITNT